MAIRIERPADPDALTDFILFHDDVYAARSARWPASVPFQLPTLTGDGPFARDRRLCAFVARDHGRPLARALAVVDARYQRHQNERLGHISMFEALPGTTEAVRLIVDAACEWLAGHGAEAARAGFGLLDFPFVVDAYEALPPAWLRQNPAHYHALLKDAGFETEQGWVDYRIEVRPELVARWESALEGAQRAGFEIVPVGAVPEARAVRDFTRVWNEAFAPTWAFTPLTETEMASILGTFGPAGMRDTSVLAYQDGEPVGALWYMPDVSPFAVLAPGRTLAPAEKLNVLGIAVRAPARGRGVNLAMAAHGYLASVRHEVTHVSYTLVLDHNWPSRRTAEKLGATVCANYVTYRRRFHRR